MTDHLSDLLLTPSPDADENLLREGIPAARIARVGNLMIDTLLAHLPRARALRVPEAMGLAPGGYAVVTLHRPANVDEPEALAAAAPGASREVARRAPGGLPGPPAHPRRARAPPRWPAAAAALRLVEPLGYLEFLSLTSPARLVLTDSGGLQEETTALGVPCLTLRENTERPVTVTEGTNQVVGTRSRADRGGGAAGARRRAGRAGAARRSGTGAPASGPPRRSARSCAPAARVAPRARARTGGAPRPARLVLAPPAGVCPPAMRQVRVRFTVEPNYAGWRLDRYLQEKIRRLSRERVQHLIEHRLEAEGGRAAQAGHAGGAGPLLRAGARPGAGARDADGVRRGPRRRRRCWWWTSRPACRSTPPPGTRPTPSPRWRASASRSARSTPPTGSTARRPGCSPAARRRRSPGS